MSCSLPEREVDACRGPVSIAVAGMLDGVKTLRAGSGPPPVRNPDDLTLRQLTAVDTGAVQPESRDVLDPTKVMVEL